MKQIDDKFPTVKVFHSAFSKILQQGASILTAYRDFDHLKKKASFSRNFFDTGFSIKGKALRKKNIHRPVLTANIEDTTGESNRKSISLEQILLLVQIFWERHKNLARLTHTI